jgi:hypothetical protein
VGSANSIWFNHVSVGMSGVGFSASAVPMQPRQFWLIADAELIVYGATEPDATVSIGVAQLSSIPMAPSATRCRSRMI